MLESTHVELLKIAAQIAAQEKNVKALAMRLKLPLGADELTVVLSIAQELRSALEIAAMPPKP
jgi:hypothetical protein